MRKSSKVLGAAVVLTIPALIASSPASATTEPTDPSPAGSEEPTATVIPADELTIGVSNLGLSFPFPAAISDGIEQEAAEYGVEVVTLDAQADVEKQSNDVQDLINQEVDGILLIGVDGVASEALVDSIAEAGIPVIAVHQMVGDSTEREMQDVYEGLSAFVTQDEQGAGAKAGELALSVLPDGGQVAIVEGAAGFAEVFNRSVLFEQTLEEADADYEVVARQPGDWTPEGAEAACQNMLQSNPDIALFYAQSDDMAVGCANAVESAGSDAQILGIGGSELGLDAIEDGSVAGTVCYKPVDMGMLGAETMITMLTTGVSLDGEYITYETPAITADNLADCEAQW
jgi:ribose transport system substrate-binding protein